MRTCKSVYLNAENVASVVPTKKRRSDFSISWDLTGVGSCITKLQEVTDDRSLTATGIDSPKKITEGFC